MRTQDMSFHGCPSPTGTGDTIHGELSFGKDRDQKTWRKTRMTGVYNKKTEEVGLVEYSNESRKVEKKQ